MIREKVHGKKRQSERLGSKMPQELHKAFHPANTLSDEAGPCRAGGFMPHDMCLSTNGCLHSSTKKAQVKVVQIRVQLFVETVQHAGGHNQKLPRQRDSHT